MNTTYQIIQEFLTEDITVQSFFEHIYSNEDLQTELENEIDIKPFTNAGSLFLFLMELDINNYQCVWVAKEAMSKFMEKKGIECEVKNTEGKLYDLISGVTPKWLNPPVDYLKSFVEDNNALIIKELKVLVKEKINSDFICLKGKPKWIQDPNWPIDDGKPLVFVGELDMTDISHDTTKVYVFYNAKNKSFTNIKQSM